MDKLSFIKSVTALKSFSDKFLVKLTEFMEHSIVQPNEIVFQEGDKSDYLYIIDTGETVVLKKISPDTEKVLSTISERDIFGEMCLFSDQPRTATVKAKTEVSFYRIHRNSFKKLLSLDLEGARKMLETLLFSALERLEQTSRELATIYEISKIIVKGLPLKDFCEEIIKQLCYSVQNVDIGLFYIWNEFTEDYEPLGMYGKKNQNITPIPKTHPIVNLITNQHETTKLDDTEPIGFNTKTAVLSPLLKNKLVGFIILANSNQPVSFKQGTYDLLNSVSLQLIGAIENIKLHEEEISKERFDRTRTGTINW